MRALRKRPVALAERERPEEARSGTLGGASPFAVRAGLKLVSEDAGRASATLSLRRESCGDGRVHTDAVSALIQAAAAAAIGSGRHPEGPSDIYITFVRPAPQDPLNAEARVVGREDPLRSCEVEVRDWNGDLVAKAFLRYRA